MTTMTRQDLINKGLIKPSQNEQSRRKPAAPAVDPRAVQARRREAIVITPTDRAMAILNATLVRAAH